MQCGRGGHAGKSSPTCAPQPEPGPSSPPPRSGAAFQAGTPVSASPHASSAKNAPSSAAPHTVHRRPLPRRLSPALGQAPPPPCALRPRPPPWVWSSPGLHRSSARRGEGAVGVTPPPRFRFPSKWDEPQNAPGPPLSSPTAEGLHPRGAVAPDGDLPRLTCGWARGAPPAPLPRRWATSGSGPRRRGGGEAVSPGARSAAPSRSERRRGGPATGGGAGAEPGAGTRGAVPGREGRRTPGLADAL